MRTTNVVQSISRSGGGLFYSVRRLTESVAEMPDMTVTVHSLRDRYSDEDRRAWRDIPIFPHPVLGPKKFGYAPKLVDGLMRDDTDLVHCHGIWMYPSLAVKRWSRRTRRPYMISIHGMLDPWAVRHSPVKKSIASFFYESSFQSGAACIRALCEPEAAAIRKYGRTNPIVVIPNGVDLPLDISGVAPEWRSRLPSGSRAMLYIGRLHPKKNLHQLIQAWHDLRKRDGEIRSWHLVIAGWDQDGYEARLRKMVADLSLANAVIFVGAQYGEAKHRTLSSADAVVLPSLSEGVPMAIMEGWSYAKPTIMTAECNLSEAFRAKASLEIGTDSESIAEGLRQFFALSEAEERSMGLAGRRLAESNYSWPVVARQVVECYRWILGGGPQPTTLFGS